MASGPGGQPVNSAPVPQSEKNKYAFIFPLRPGETRFQVNYHLPYSGKIKIGPRPLYATDHVVIMLPKTMQFTGGGAGYQTMSGGDPDANIQVITNVNPGQDLSFNLSGTGTIQEGQQTATAGGGWAGWRNGAAPRRSRRRTGRSGRDSGSAASLSRIHPGRAGGSAGAGRVLRGDAAQAGDRGQQCLYHRSPRRPPSERQRRHRAWTFHPWPRRRREMAIVCSTR